MVPKFLKASSNKLNYAQTPLHNLTKNSKNP